MASGSRAGAFSDRVVVLFATQVIATGVGVINGFLLAGLLGPAGKGDYYLLVLLPGTVFILFQLGLPQAFGFFAARGQALGVVAKTLILTAALSLVATPGVLVLLPFLRETFFHGIGLAPITLAFVTVPLALNVAFTTSIVVGRQAVRWYAAVNAAFPIATTLLLIVIVGGLGLSVTGAILVYVVAWCIQTVGFLIGAAHVSAAVDRPQSVSYRELFGYGLPFYPGTITQYFSYRADIYILAWLLAEPSASIGYYSVAVALVEMLFLLPNSVSLLFFPQVAASLREDSDRQVPRVCRVTLLLTFAFAMLLAPAATLAIRIFLPAFLPSLPALFVLLPGVVALSATRILSGYVSGLGLTAITSYVNVGAFVLNVAVNIVLIPRLGIVGASVASLVSYSASSFAFTVIGARLAHARVLDFWVPRKEDVRFALGSVLSLARRLPGTGAGGV